ncbi:FKBP-type peptidyl-prolyl isomerase-like protein [Arcticibacter pallidicorallinus]|uniref:Peptidyl-prolyl cis-trans isomerase n=2 Tax=Arcticibacter pallidicorallinus TaxID=1259464 RepID=A0A2T0U958_9SPHI|nr:FKBP-type peptidyl-prolyl isomerase-like protein [Arcticibacter pallidicorallinus]
MSRGATDILNMRKLVFVALLFAVIGSSCSKIESYDMEKQMAIDEKVIKDFIAEKNLANVKRTDNGVYYIIEEPGSGDVKYTRSTTIKAKYEGRLLNGKVFDSSKKGDKDEFTFALGDVIPGWQIGIQLIQKGGKIRLLIPSPFAYQNRGQGSIPANAVLDFDVELLDVTNPQ